MVTLVGYVAGGIESSKPGDDAPGASLHCIPDFSIWSHFEPEHCGQALNFGDGKQLPTVRCSLPPLRASNLSNTATSKFRFRSSSVQLLMMDADSSVRGTGQMRKLAGGALDCSRPVSKISAGAPIE